MEQPCRLNYREQLETLPRRDPRSANDLKVDFTWDKRPQKSPLRSARVMRLEQFDDGLRD